MVLRKITIDNSVRYFPRSEKTKEGDIKPKTVKAGSFPRKQNKKYPQNIENFLENAAANGVGKFTKKYSYKFQNKYIIVNI